MRPSNVKRPFHERNPHIDAFRCMSVHAPECKSVQKARSEPMTLFDGTAMEAAAKAMNRAYQEWLVEIGDIPPDDVLPWDDLEEEDRAYCLRIAPHVLGAAQGSLRERNLVVVPENTVIGACNLLDTIKGEWLEGEHWSAWDQSIRDGLTAALKSQEPAP